MVERQTRTACQKTSVCFFEATSLLKTLIPGDTVMNLARWIRPHESTLQSTVYFWPFFATGSSVLQQRIHCEQSDVSMMPFKAMNATNDIAIVLLGDGDHIDRRAGWKQAGCFDQR